MARSPPFSSEVVADPFRAILGALARGGPRSSGLDRYDLAKSLRATPRYQRRDPPGSHEFVREGDDVAHKRGTDGSLEIDRWGYVAALSGLDEGV